ncbi:MAG TPA: hypothetical protein PKL65_06740 [Bacteroidales bacterium]|nr:hypothetical protein [Bacteroidales bacterium]HNR41912.1 hypothetical protein [Bacteroidales bacterium]
MILLIRFILIAIIIYLLLKSFARFLNYRDPEEEDRTGYFRADSKTREVSKKIGEYVDYEEIKDDKKRDV